MAAGNGQPDSFFIARVRRELRDQPVWFPDTFPTDGTNGTNATAGAKPYRLQRAPVVSGSAVLSAPGGPWTVVYDTPPTAGHVEIVTDTGEVIFPSAPAVGTLSVTYQAQRFSDTQVTDALYEGLALLWPELFAPIRSDNAILISPTIFSYALPSQFQDINTQMLKVEYQPPSGIIRTYETAAWEISPDTTNPKIDFTKLPPIGSVVSITYTAPMTSLGQTPTGWEHLPVYYALARLLLDQETMRSRSDDLAALKGEAANRPGTAIATADYWLARFNEQLNKLTLGLPIRWTIQDRVADRLGLSGIWRAD